MRVVVQRVQSSAVMVEDRLVGAIGVGLNLLVAIAPSDTPAELQWMARKCLELRIFPDGETPWARSVRDIQGEILAVSQFTLYGDAHKGRRPSFSGAAKLDRGEALYGEFVQLLRQSGLRVATGEFGANMMVTIANDGPVTLLLEREANRP